MPKQSFKADVNPELIKWAVETAGWKKSELVKKLDISESTYEGWLEGSAKPTIKQLEKLAKKTKRPLASFFLPKAPKKDPKPKDRRQLPDKKGEFEQKTIFAIRKARYLQEISYELLLNLQQNPRAKLRKTTLKENPEEIASLYREKFNLDEKRFSSKPYVLYNYLRDVLEDFNVFSFQISMPLNDARGFALADKIPRVIVVNSIDDIKPRIFTLLHEFGHILLGETSIDIPHFGDQSRIERWCNNFAASFLLPKDVLEKIYHEYEKNIMSRKILKRISNRYNVSESMFVYNLSKYNYISKRYYQNFLDAVTKTKKKKSSSGGAVTQDKKCLSTLGKKFVSLVADNIEKEQITTNDALSYLSIKSRNLDKVISKAGK
jgi:Zn-dependent peptidase ImmA (M78 family)